MTLPELGGGGGGGADPDHDWLSADPDGDPERLSDNLSEMEELAMLSDTLDHDFAEPPDIASPFTR